MVLRSAVEAAVLNPKSLELSDLYGYYNAATSEWRDGLVSSVVRRATAAAAAAAAAGVKGQQDWVVFDGPVDAGWIESMNTGELRASGSDLSLELHEAAFPLPHRYRKCCRPVDVEEACTGLAAAG